MNEAEELLAIHLAELGVAFERQFAYAPGRKFRADFVVRVPWEGHRHALCLFQPILIEVQGGVFPMRRRTKDGREYTSAGAHGTVTGIKADNARLNEATKAGYMMLRFLPEEVEDGRAKATIAEVLGC